ncbi:DNA (cytosine-5-)-methyltransferase [Fonsecaea nubica]|uniref:DNA (Cytosine-5-)-methyltransferase n=1 Tax=Fonsecaea nubica TaxID=856822 RepID=A0A178D0E5_9EURO|nr:DNA (cytosine-5-)-methyltransferase [Fonsecaea nubica]OAL35549.1 DNA (cytosine-5-)-methyltransferase [Fonsecaea nubica]
MTSNRPESRQILSHQENQQQVALGRLYDARTETVLFPSIFNSTLLPGEFVQSTDLKRLSYKCTESDSLEEKLSNLGISSELGLSVLCGMAEGSWCANYLSTKKVNTHIRQASTACTYTTRSESLFLQNKSLRDRLDFAARHIKDATHVVCGINWGARALVTVKESVKHEDTSSETKFNLNKPPGSAKYPRGERMQPKETDFFRKLVQQIGQIYVGGKVEWDSSLRATETVLEFEIAADVANIVEGGIPTNFEQVKNFLQRIPSSLEGVNEGKGVPISFYLLPIQDFAMMFQIEIHHDTLVRKLEQTVLEHCLSLLEKLDATARDWEVYGDRVAQHQHCVPKAHIREVRIMRKQAERNATFLRKDLTRGIVGFRQGFGDKQNILDLLGPYDAPDSCDEDDGPILGEYVDKMDFVDTIKAAGVGYIDHTQLCDTLSSNRTGDMYILYLSKSSQGSQSWSEDRQTLIDLINGMGDEYLVLAVDYDAPEPKALKESYIEQRRGSRVIVPNVTQKWNDLNKLCQLKCGVDKEADRTRSVNPPLGRRVVRVPCPGQNCFRTGNLKWICPICEDMVCYGFTDDYLYCLCSRYLYTEAVFKCNGAVHGPEFVQYEERDLHKRLKDLDPGEEYNILILGKSGVGKSMFINAISNYLVFESLKAAIDDTDDIQYALPFQFRFQDEKKKDQAVTVGKERLRQFAEVFSNSGKSSTRKSNAYCFTIDGKVFRFIDTPGICDTEGKDQDHTNAKDVYEMLMSIKKLSAVLILLPPNETRLDSAFRYCMTELLSRLHHDTSHNVLFAFTNASSTNFTLGATQTPLDAILRDLNTGIVRGVANQYFVDSKGFMFLAAHKQNLEMAGTLDEHAELWRRSAEEVGRLIATVMKLPTHDVGMTLKLHQTENFLDGMAKPLASFITTSKETLDSLKKAEDELTDAIARGENLAQKAKNRLTITVPVRYDLKHKRTVCCHPSCVSQVQGEDGNLRTAFTTICHNECDVDVPDEIRGAAELRFCRPFRRVLQIIWGYECKMQGCGHDWTDHMHISYELRNEIRTIDDETVLEDIKSNEDAVQRIERKILEAKLQQKTAQEELDRIQDARVKFYVYRALTSLGTSRAQPDPTVTYLDLHIAIAKNDGRQSDAAELMAQKSEHVAKVEALTRDITAGKASCPDERVVDSEIEGLRAMPLFGKYLSEAVGPSPEPVQETRHLYVDIKPKQVGTWMGWLRRA